MKPWKSFTQPTTSKGRASFNGATAMKPWKSMTPATFTSSVYTLQWGHGDEAVEERACVLAWMEAMLASMGPRR